MKVKSSLYYKGYHKTTRDTLPQMTVYFVTGNDKKWKEIEEIFGAGFFQRSRIDLPELQGASLKEIALQKAKLAYAEIKLNTNEPVVQVIVEDTALCFDAMGEMPGPYIKWFLEAIGPEGLCRLLDGFNSRSAKAICTMVLIDQHGQEHLFQGVTAGVIAQQPRGENRFGWDPVFVPEESNGLSYAEMASEAKNQISHRSRALAQLKTYFSQ